MPSFNLVEQPWIPCTTIEGNPCELSLRDLFRRAHQLRAVEDDSPLCVAALHRILLAVVHRAVDGPRKLKNWMPLWEQGDFSQTPIDDYLTMHADRFDLFSETAPFYQTAGFELKEPSSAARLLIELSRRFFNHPPDGGGEDFTPAEAARALVTAQASALAGGKGVTSEMFKEHPYLSGGPMVGCVMVLLIGDTLFETLLLNLLEYTDEKPMLRLGEDKPIWERTAFPEKPIGQRPPDGWLDYLTWPSRHVRLLPELDGDRVVVRNMYIGQANSLPPARQPDPLCFYRVLPGTADTMPVGLSPERALWRDSGSLFAFTEKEDRQRPKAFLQASRLIKHHQFLPPEKSLRCNLLGLAAHPQRPGLPVVWRQETFPVPQHLLIDQDTAAQVDRAVQFSEEVGGQLNAAAKKLAELLLAAGDENRKPDKKAASNLARSFGTLGVFWASLDVPFREFLDALAPENQAALLDWKERVVRLVRDAFNETSDNCLGRGVRELQARAKAEGFLTSMLAKHKPDSKSPEN